MSAFPNLQSCDFCETKVTQFNYQSTIFCYQTQNIKRYLKGKFTVNILSADSSLNSNVLHEVRKAEDVIDSDLKLSGSFDSLAGVTPIFNFRLIPKISKELFF
jgi:hypothetical protein